ncbi:hypothetical protein AAG565_15730 [Fontimonas sp. SYSU GA230001]|uniref:hypothetical protein n=1 Tax=Fontimonas sp. SYSU GA230001 TaxID=3142450 RepID=UPI0032B59BB9
MSTASTSKATKVASSREQANKIAQRLPGALLTLLGVENAHASLTYNSDKDGSGGGEKSITYGGITLGRFKYAWGYYFRYRCGFMSSGVGCEAFGEFYAAGNLKYAATGSDNVMAVLPLGVVCTNYCAFSGTTQFTTSMVNDKWLGGSPNFDGVDYAISSGSLENWKLRGDGSFISHTAKERLIKSPESALVGSDECSATS